jgi:hypothetical protein
VQAPGAAPEQPIDAGPSIGRGVGRSPPQQLEMEAWSEPWPTVGPFLTTEEFCLQYNVRRTTEDRLMALRFIHAHTFPYMPSRVWQRLNLSPEAEAELRCAMTRWAAGAIE